MKKPEGEIPTHTSGNYCFGNLTIGVLSDLNSKEITVSHRKTYKTFESQVDSSESYLSRSVLCCKLPQVSPVCSLLFSCKLVVFSQRDVPCQGLQPRRCGLVLYSASAR